jgi:hypothetical protein
MRVVVVVSRVAVVVYTFCFIKVMGASPTSYPTTEAPTSYPTAYGWTHYPTVTPTHYPTAYGWTHYPTTAPTRQYRVKYEGTCEEYLTSMAECDLAATAGLAAQGVIAEDTDSSSQNSWYKPQGCYYNGNYRYASLYFNQQVGAPHQH